MNIKKNAYIYLFVCVLQVNFKNVSTYVQKLIKRSNKNNNFVISTALYYDKINLMF